MLPPFLDYCTSLHCSCIIIVWKYLPLQMHNCSDCAIVISINYYSNWNKNILQLFPYKKVFTFLQFYAYAEWMCMTQWKLHALKASQVSEGGKLNFPAVLVFKKREENLLICSVGLKLSKCTISPASFTYSWQSISPARKWSKPSRQQNKSQYDPDAQAVYSNIRAWVFPLPRL